MRGKIQFAYCPEVHESQANYQLVCLLKALMRSTMRIGGKSTVGHTLLCHTHTHTPFITQVAQKNLILFRLSSAVALCMENGPREWQKRSLLLWLVRSAVALIRHFIKESFAWVAVHLHDKHNRLPSIQHTHTLRDENSRLYNKVAHIFNWWSFCSSSDHSFACIATNEQHEWTG